MLPGGGPRVRPGGAVDRVLNDLALRLTRPFEASSHPERPGGGQGRHGAGRGATRDGGSARPRHARGEDEAAPSFDRALIYVAPGTAG